MLLETEYDGLNNIANKPPVSVRRYELAQRTRANKKRRVCAACFLLY